MNQSNRDRSKNESAKGEIAGVKARGRYYDENSTLPSAKPVHIEKPVTLFVPQRTQPRQWPEKLRACFNLAIAETIASINKPIGRPARAGKP